MRNLFIFSLLCTGCMTHWSKPGATEVDLRADKILCKNEAYQANPVRMTQSNPPTKYNSTAQCKRGLTGNITCDSITVPDGSQDLNNIPVDQNARARGSTMKACLLGKGWVPDR